MDVAVEICRSRRAPNFESEYGYLVADVLFAGRATNAVSRVEASREFVSTSAAQSELHRPIVLDAVQLVDGRMQNLGSSSGENYLHFWRP